MTCNEMVSTIVGINMVKVLPIIVLLASIAGCKKSDNETAVEKAIKGSWEMRSSFCGIGSFTNYAPSSGTIITFKNDNHFTSTGPLADSGLYRITANPTTPNQPAYLFLDGKQNLKCRVTINYDTLHLDLVAFTTDGYWYDYHKL